MPRRKKSSGWGGRRPGAGAKRVLDDAVLFAVRIPRADLARLRTIARRKGVSVSEHVRGVLQRSLARSR